MSFLLIPAGAWTEVVAGHPHPGVISDALGGAVPADLYLPNVNCATWVRETAATEGLDRNLVASVVGLLFGGIRVPVLGPAALTTVAWLPSGAGVAECFSDIALTAMHGVCNDLGRALDGVDHGYSQPALERDGWPDKIRLAGAIVSTMPISDDWPYLETPQHRMDPVAAALRRAGLGREFVPIVTDAL